MDQLDLSDVDPLKWAETRRRAAAIREYLDLPYPDVADRERFASSLGIGAHQFANLVKAWKATGRAVALSPGSRRPDRPSRSKRGGVDPAAREIARTIIGDADPIPTFDQLRDRIASACAASGVEPPSRGTIWLLARERRDHGGRDGVGDAVIVVGRAFLRLPVDTGTAIVLPEIALAVDMRTTRIIAATTPEVEPHPNASRLAQALASDVATGVSPIEADARDAAMLAASLPSGMTVAPIAATDASTKLSHALGPRIGRIHLAYSRPTIRPATLMQSGRDKAPGIGDAAAALAFACRSHNSQVGRAA